MSQQQSRLASGMMMTIPSPEPIWKKEREKNTSESCSLTSHTHFLLKNILNRTVQLAITESFPLAIPVR